MHTPLNRIVGYSSFILLICLLACTTTHSTELYVVYSTPADVFHLAKINYANPEAVEHLGMLGHKLITALEFAGDGTLYAYESPQWGPGQFYRVNPLDGALEPIGEANSQRIDGLAYSPVDGKMYGVHADFTSRLFSIDLVTGDLTLEGTIVENGPVAWSWVAAIGVDHSGYFYVYNNAGDIGVPEMGIYRSTEPGGLEFEWIYDLKDEFGLTSSIVQIPACLYMDWSAETVKGYGWNRELDNGENAGWFGYDWDESGLSWAHYPVYPLLNTKFYAWTNAPAPGTNLVAGPGKAYENPPLVRVFPAEQDASPDHEFAAYGPEHYGVNVACGDVDGDQFDEILTGAGPGEIFGPHVRGFQGDGTPHSGISFLAYGTNKYGVIVAAGDIDGDGFDEIITGAGPGAVFGPHVRGWDYDGTGEVTPIPGVSFFAYGTPKWGVNVSCGDIDGDGYDEIVTGAGPGTVYGPHVRGWNYDGAPPVSPIPGCSFFAYGTYQYGVNVSCGDVDGDGVDEIITAPGPGPMFGAHVRGFEMNGTPLPGLSFFAWEYPDIRYGATVFAGSDLDGNGWNEIVVGSGPDPDADTMVKVFTYDGSQVTEWFWLEAFPGMTWGTNVAAGRL